MILNSRIYQFNGDVIDSEILKECTHLRGFSADFKKRKPNGLYETVSDEQIKEWSDFVIKNNLKVVWTLYMTKDRTLKDELKLVKRIINYGVEITHFQMGGEFWLYKYFLPDFTKKGVVERVTIYDYLDMLNEWLPVIEKEFPNTKPMLLGCSHSFNQSQVDNLISKFESDLNGDIEGMQNLPFKYYRPIWNYLVLNYIKDLNKDYGITIHYYAGAKPDLQPSNGEEAILEGINWLPFINQMRRSISNIEIITPEAAWYPDKEFFKSDTTLERRKELFKKCIEFIEKQKEAIGEYGIPGLHLLQSRETYLGLYTLNDITKLGELYKEYFNRNTEVPLDPEFKPKPEEPILVNVSPAESRFVIWGKQSLFFSDGSKIKIKVKYGYFPFSINDLGKTKLELTK